MVVILTVFKILLFLSFFSRRTLSLNTMSSSYYCSDKVSSIFDLSSHFIFFTPINFKIHFHRIFVSKNFFKKLQSIYFLCFLQFFCYNFYVLFMYFILSFQNYIFFTEEKLHTRLKRLHQLTIDQIFYRIQQWFLLVSINDAQLFNIQPVEKNKRRRPVLTRGYETRLLFFARNIFSSLLHLFDEELTTVLITIDGVQNT